MTDAVREEDHEPETPLEVPSDAVAAALCERFAGSTFFESLGQAVVYIDKAHQAEVAKYLRDEERFTMLIDICAVDHVADAVRHCAPGVTQERFELVTQYLSHARNRRIRTIAQISDSDTTAPSITAVFPGANFSERETFDLFGIEFEGHPDHSRILLPDDWEGHPLRKDYAPARVPVTFKGDPSPR